MLGRHHELVNRYEISIYQMVIDLFPLRRFRLSSFTEKIFSGTDYEYHETELLTLLENFDSPPIFL